jgi:hypothetical protein
MGVTFIKGRNIRKVCVCGRGGGARNLRKGKQTKKMCKAKEGKQRKIFTFKIPQQIPTQAEGQKICAS